MTVAGDEQDMATSAHRAKPAGWISRGLRVLNEFVSHRSRPSGSSPTADERSRRTHAGCLIIGAGHNGLSVGTALRKRGIDPILLDAHDRVGDQWRERYERLHLHHITDVMHLPGVPYPPQYPRYLSRLDFADYLEGYARLQALDVRCRHKVERLERSTTGIWEASVRRPGEQAPLRFTADNVVLAAGSTGVIPRIPRLEGLKDWAGQVLHSQQYRSAEEFRGKRVLVVGAGNSGIEICCDLYDHGADTSILIRGPNSWVTREAYASYHRLLQYGRPVVKYVPFTWLLAPFFILGVDVWCKLEVRRRYGDLSDKGIQELPGPAMIEMARSQGTRPPTYVDGTWGNVGVSLFDLIRCGKLPTYTAEISRLVPGSSTVEFKDGKRGEFDVVLLCTGFEPMMSHYGSFVDEKVLGTLQREDVFRFLGPMKELPGLWISMGGIVGSRFGQDTLGGRIAASIRGIRQPGRILNPMVAFFFAGIEPIQFQVPRITIIINALAALGLLAITLLR